MPRQTFFNLPEEKRRAIIDAAIDEFAENDYEQASISRIVAQVGIAKGSIYQYFDDKKDLYLYLVDLAAQEKQRFLAGLQPPDPRMNIFDYLRWLARVGVDFELSNPRLGQVAYRAIYGDLPFHDETLARVREVSRRYVAQLVQQGIDQGDVAQEIDPDLAGFVLNTLIVNLGSYILDRIGADPRDVIANAREHLDLAAYEQVFDQFVRIVQYGLAAERPAPGEH